MKILQLSPRFPYPPDDGGKISIANVHKHFAMFGCEVKFFSYYNETIDDEAMSEAEQYGKIDLFRHSTANTPYRIAKSFLLNQSIYLTKHISRRVQRHIANLLNNIKFDIIHADHSAMAPLALFAKEKCGLPVGLRLHNVEWLIWQRYAETLPKFSMKRIFVERQAKLLREGERKLYEKCDVLIAITDEDKARALELVPAANIITATAGVTETEWSPDRTVERNPYEMIIATTYDWVHNVEGVRWFIEYVLPAVVKKFPEAKLKLIGKKPPEEFFHKKSVECVGYVPNVQPYHNKASIFISPLFVGSGIRIKILEAMAMELPVVATSIAAEGIKANENDGLFRADTPKDFTEKILFLMENPHLTCEFGQKARHRILNDYTWNANVKKIVNEYERIIEGK